MCKRRLSGSVERDPAGKARSAADLPLQDRSEHISENVLQKKAARRNSTYAIAMEEIEACLAAPNTVETEFEARELARVIESFLDTLTAENRVIFMRRYWFSDSCKDIAKLVGLTEKNISVRLTRIRRKMKKYLIEKEVFL